MHPPTHTLRALDGFESLSKHWQRLVTFPNQFSVSPRVFSQIKELSLGGRQGGWVAGAAVTSSAPQGNAEHVIPLIKLPQRPLTAVRIKAKPITMMYKIFHCIPSACVSQFSAQSSPFPHSCA